MMGRSKRSSIDGSLTQNGSSDAFVDFFRKWLPAKFGSLESRETMPFSLFSACGHYPKSHCYHFPYFLASSLNGCGGPKTETRIILARGHEVIKACFSALLR